MGTTPGFTSMCLPDSHQEKIFPLGNIRSAHTPREGTYDFHIELVLKFDQYLPKVNVQRQAIETSIKDKP